MKDNAIVSFFKLCGTLLLAFLVWLTYYQSGNREEIALATKGKVDQIQADMQTLRTANLELRSTNDRLAGQVEALKDVLASGAVMVGNGELWWQKAPDVARVVLEAWFEARAEHAVATR